MVMIFLRIGVVPSTSMEFHFPVPGRNLKATINVGKESTVLSHFTSKSEESSSYAVAPDLVDKSNGLPPANGLRMMVLAGVGAPSTVTAFARAVSAAVRSSLLAMFLRCRALEDLVDALIMSYGSASR